MTAPITPAAAPAATAPIADVPTAPAGPVGLPPGFGSGGAPKIGNLSSTAGGGIPDEHFNKPLLIRIISVGPRSSKYEDGQVQAPTVDYIALDPSNGTYTEVRGVTLMQKNIRRDIVDAHNRGLEAVTGVAMLVQTSNSNPAKVLRPLDETNSGYGVEQATKYLTDAAMTQFGWWPAS